MSRERIVVLQVRQLPGSGHYFARYRLDGINPPREMTDPAPPSDLFNEGVLDVKALLYRRLDIQNWVGFFKEAMSTQAFELVQALVELEPAATRSYINLTTSIHAENKLGFYRAWNKLWELIEVRSEELSELGFEWSDAVKEEIDQVFLKNNFLPWIHDSEEPE